MKHRIAACLAIISLAVFTACSNRSSYVVVEESEFGHWQNEVESIKETLESISDLSFDTLTLDLDDTGEIMETIEELKSRVEDLEDRMHRNFISSEELPNSSIPSRYF
ncbi:MAG: hypothetical protein IJ202_06345 [Bacteroidales bacterium]|nr:hypothetical protein [Bacteroidales bacterium]